MTNAPEAARRWLLIVCHFVCPLLFFTNFTRNPYITQIVLLHAGVGLAVAAWAWEQALRPDGWKVPRLAVWAPLLLFLAAWGLSWLRAYWGHAAFFRPSMIAEGSRNALFLVVICMGGMLLSASIAAEDDGTSDVPLGGWTAFALLWGALWFFYAPLRSRVIPRPEDIFAQIWTGYGALVWAAGLFGAWRLTRRGRMTDFLHLALCAGFLASVYGVLQYFNREFLWPYTLNPYGGRAVSTFGNPNFLSSYNVALMPAALGLFLSEKRTGRRLVYAAVFLAMQGALLATLTRSSWGGALAGCSALLALSPWMRLRVREQPRAAGLLAAAAAALTLLWPSSAISAAYTPTVIERFVEVREALEKSGSYSPLHQRVLIWSCGWLMGSENPVLGKGGGLFELFYPFYQGHMLQEFTFFHNMRTHANNAHNELVEVFAQTGLIGLGAFAGVWAAFFAAAKRWAGGRLGEDAAWAGAAAGCAGVLVDNMLNVSLHFAVPGFMFWWCAGLVLGRAAKEGVAPWSWNGGPGARRAAATLALLAALGAAWIETRVWMREAWYFAGHKLVRHGDLEGAAKALERSRAWGPREVNALYELGNTYARSKKHAQAAEGYRAALAANAGYDEIFFNLGTLLNVYLGDPAEALENYETSYAINPLNQDVINALSALYLRDSSRLDAAIAMLRQAARDFSGNPNHWNNLGYALALRKDWAESEAAYERALSIAPELELAERNLAALAAQSGRPRSIVLTVLGELRALEAALAKQDYSDRTLSMAAAISRRAPQVAKGRFLHGSLLLARGRSAEALPELEAAVRLDPRRPAGRINLGNALLALGRPSEAEAQFRAALAAEPGNPAALERLRSMGLRP